MDLKAVPSGQTTLLRASLLDALASLIPPEVVHLGKRLERLSEDTEDVQLYFDDGTTVRADVVVGCDGIRSRVKESMQQLPGQSGRQQPRYSGMYAYRAVLDMERAVEAVGDHRARVSSLYVGDGAYGISYPTMRAKKVNIGIYVFSEKWDCDLWIRPARKEDMQRDTANLGRYIQSLVEVCDYSFLLFPPFSSLLVFLFAYCS